MTRDLQDAHEIEIDLILQTWTGRVPADCPILSPNYYFQDHTNGGIGLVISENMPPAGNLDRAITNFLTPLVAHAAEFKRLSPVLLVGVYNPSLTCTVNIKCLTLIQMFGAELSITVHHTA